MPSSIHHHIRRRQDASPVRKTHEEEARFLRRLSKAINKWDPEDKLARFKSPASKLAMLSEVSHPAVKRLIKWEAQRASPYLATVVMVLAALGKRLKIVDLDTATEGR